MSSLPPESNHATQHIRSKAEVLAHQKNLADRRKLYMTLAFGTVVVLVAIAIGTASATKALDPAPVARATGTVEQPIKRPTAEGVTDKDIVKWVPMRLASGRTEHEAFTTLDEEWVNDPSIIDKVMSRHSDRQLMPGPEHWPIIPLDTPVSGT